MRNEKNESQMEQNNSSPVAPEFNAVRLLYLMMSCLLAGSVAVSVSKFFGWAVAVPIGLSLSLSFCMLVKNVVAAKETVSVAWRVTCILAAALIFCVTMGLSYGTLYQTFLAEDSALSYFQKMREPVQRQLETVHANAATAADSFTAWSAHSKQKSELEAQGGGTCPAKAASLGRRGPIAMFREGEASIAADLNAAIQGKVAAIGAQLTLVKGQKPRDYKGVLGFSAEINAAVEMAETLAHGAFVQSTKETLQRQLDAVITWPNGETFKCADTARDELINRAMSALTSLEKTAPITALAPAIDLSNPQAVAIRGVLRAFNSIAKVSSGGVAGQFEDDPLMAAALKKGVLNQESIGMVIAALLEFIVVVLAILSAGKRQPIYVRQTDGWLQTWESAAKAESRSAHKSIQLLGIACIKGVTNVLWSYPVPAIPSKNKRHDSVIDSLEVMDAEMLPETSYPPRELAWGLALAPYLISMHDGDYICLPAGRNLRGTQAARALAYRGVAKLMSTTVELDLVGTYNRAAASHLQRLVPDAKSVDWEMYVLDPDYSQALRVKLLAPGVLKERTMMSNQFTTEEKSND